MLWRRLSGSHPSPSKCSLFPKSLGVDTDSSCKSSLRERLDMADYMGYGAFSCSADVLRRCETDHDVSRQDLAHRVVGAALLSRDVEAVEGLGQPLHVNLRSAFLA